MHTHTYIHTYMYSWFEQQQIGGVAEDRQM